MEHTKSGIKNFELRKILLSLVDLFVLVSVVSPWWGGISYA